MTHRSFRKGLMFNNNVNLIMPDDKPDIDFLLRATSIPVIEKTIVSINQVTFSGYFDIFTEYVSCVPDGTQPVTFVRFKLPINQTFAYRHARLDMNAHLKGRINIDYMQLTSPRTITASINLYVVNVKLARACKPLPPHLFKPCLINFLDTGNPSDYSLTYCTEFCSEQPSNL